MKPLSFRRFTWGVILLICLIVGGSVILCVWLHDPHWLNRGGAAIAALSAGAILFQLRLEVRLEREREGLVRPRANISEASTPVDPIRKIQRTAESNHRARLEALFFSRRLEIASVVVLAAVMGELLHGFGDLIMVMFLR